VELAKFRVFFSATTYSSNSFFRFLSNLCVVVALDAALIEIFRINIVFTISRLVVWLPAYARQDMLGSGDGPGVVVPKFVTLDVSNFGG
jgi:hypothetical protein